MGSYIWNFQGEGPRDRNKNEILYRCLSHTWDMLRCHPHFCIRRFGIFQRGNSIFARPIRSLCQADPNGLEALRNGIEAALVKNSYTRDTRSDQIMTKMRRGLKKARGRNMNTHNIFRLDKRGGQNMHNIFRLDKKDLNTHNIFRL